MTNSTFNTMFSVFAVAVFLFCQNSVTLASANVNVTIDSSNTTTTTIFEVSNDVHNNTNRSAPVGKVYTLDMTKNVTKGVDKTLKSAIKTACSEPCASYHAGASESMPFVAMVMKSGTQGAEKFACYPPHNAHENWNVCYQPGTIEGEKQITVDDDDDEVDFLVPTYSNAEKCAEIAELTAPQASSGAMGARSSAPTAKGGWMKVAANIECGWGSTYWNVNPGYDYSPRLQYDVASEYECCMKALELDPEQGDLDYSGGAAVRFQLKDGVCRIDRELLLNGNLDGSSGFAQKDQDPCGTEGEFQGDMMYWRHAAGGAEASNLKSAGACQAENNFKILKGDKGAVTPVFRLPASQNEHRGNDFPNHACNGKDEHDEIHGGKCTGLIRYFPIGDAEECCRACTELRFVNALGGNEFTDIQGGTEKDENGNFLNPCVAWQIVEGKCQIVREKFVLDEYAGSTVEAAVQRGTDCTPGGTDSNGCNYFSHLYYRETDATANGGKGDIVPPAVDAGLVSEKAVFVTPMEQMSFVVTAQDEELEKDVPVLMDTVVVSAYLSSVPTIKGKLQALNTNTTESWIETTVANCRNAEQARKTEDAKDKPVISVYSMATSVTVFDDGSSVVDPTESPICETSSFKVVGGKCLMESVCLLRGSAVFDNAERRLTEVENACSLGDSSADDCQSSRRRLAEEESNIGVSFGSRNTGKNRHIFENLQILLMNDNGKSHVLKVADVSTTSGPESTTTTTTTTSESTTSTSSTTVVAAGHVHSTSGCVGRNSGTTSGIAILVGLCLSFAVYFTGILFPDYVR